MPRTIIPAGITRDDILQAIADLKAGTIAHEFYESERFDLIYEGGRFAPKAVLGVAARRVAGRLLVPADFSGGENSQCFKLLRSLGFEVLLKEPPSAWIFQGNPDQFDVEGILAERDEIEWAVRQKHYAPLMTVGRLVYLWKAAGKRKERSGIVAVCEIVISPREIEEDTEAPKFWRTDQPVGPLLRVRLKLRRRFLGENILAAASIAESESLRDLAIFSLRTSTNYPLSPLHAAALNQLTSGDASQKLGATKSAALNFEVGREYNRQADLHGPFGGQERGGIATPSHFPAVFLFTGVGGGLFGYENVFRNDGVFLYTGEGQTGDMKFLRGNLAIKESNITGRQLFLFEQTRRGFVRFIGKASYLGHHFTERPDANGSIRQAIIFELEVGADSPPSIISPDGAGKLTLPEPKSLADLRAAAVLATPYNLTPKERRTVVHYRSEAVKRYVLVRAAGKCEGCDADAPFLNRKKQAYLEPHHTTRRSDGGPDAPQHVIALCPNCHRRVHSGLDGDEYNKTLIARLGVIEAYTV